MSQVNYINVPIGPAKVVYGEGLGETVFETTKGGVNFQANTSKQDITVDQFGDTPVKSILKGRTCQVTVPFALNDLEKLAATIPNSEYVKDGDKQKIVVKSNAGFDLTKTAKKLVIIPLDPDATPNDYITIPAAAALGDPQYTYNSDNERIVNITFVGFPNAEGDLYILGDETATEA